MASATIDNTTSDVEVSENGADTENVTETTATENDTADGAEKQTRKRVDLNTLPDDESVQYTINMPAGLKKAIIKRSESEGKNANVIGLVVLAEAFMYNVPDSFLEVKRKSFSSEEEKAKAQMDQRLKMAAVLAALEAGAIDPNLLAQFTPASLPTRKRRAKTEDVE